MSRAVILLRVSDESQTKRAGAEQGYSFEYQRDRCYDEAAKREADVVREFVAPAESASNGMYRTLREALDFVREDGNIDYFIIYMLDRFIRDELTQFQTYAELRGVGTDLVSATEKIDNTPAGLLQMAVLASVNAYRSRNDGVKVKDGMRKKAELGGTPGRAKLGYLNKQRMDGRNSIRTVEIDPTRSPHIQFAFQAFATSEWSLSALVEELYERGLRSNPGGRTPGKVGRSSLHRILRDPYYKGVVIFKGIEYEGTHERLIPDTLFERVQQILDARSKGRDNSWRHRHYVKGSVFCANCDGRLLFTRVTGNGGEYDYFICAGRHRGTGCTLPYLPAEWVEQRTTDYYRKEVERLGERLTAAEPQLVELFGLLTEHKQKSADRSRAEIERIEGKRRRLVSDHLARPNAIPLDVLEAEQANLSASLTAARGELEKAEARLDRSNTGLKNALALLREAPKGYERIDPETRRRLNQAIFKRLLVSVEGIDRVEFTEEFEGLVDDKLPPLAEKIAAAPKTSSFKLGPNLDHAVPRAGFEPAACRLGGDRSIQLSYRGEGTDYRGLPPSGSNELKSYPD
jgi:site-specific DNA recombinase